MLVLQANASRDAPLVAIRCDATNSPLQAATPQPAGTATNSGGETAVANAAEALVLYAMQKVAAKATRYMLTIIVQSGMILHIRCCGLSRDLHMPCSFLLNLLQSMPRWQHIAQ